MKNRRSRNDRWCSCEHSIEVNAQWDGRKSSFWPEWHLKNQWAQGGERIGDFGISAFEREVCRFQAQAYTMMIDQSDGSHDDICDQTWSIIFLPSYLVASLLMSLIVPWQLDSGPKHWEILFNGPDSHQCKTWRHVIRGSRILSCHCWRTYPIDRGAIVRREC